MRVIAFLLCWPGVIWAQDIVVIGEIHDNPHHHEMQAEKVQALKPAALVFEMLTAEQVALITLENRGDKDRLAHVLGWDESGWPDFDYYFPIMEAAPVARIFGAGLTRDQAQATLSQSPEHVFGERYDRFGLKSALPADQQSAREAHQMAAHCDALPEEMLGTMVTIQRLRDTMIARAAIEALEQTGGPVAVITGNGHARKDWGMPAVLRYVAPELSVFVVGQTEDDLQIEGEFDEILSSPAPVREDPCAAFK